MPGTPAALRRCFDTASAPAVTVRGDLTLLDGTLTGFFCSVRCPGDVILKTYDLAKALRGTDITLIGGFQSPMEKEFLDVLLWGRVHVVICPARGLGNMRVPKIWRAPLTDGRLLILSFLRRQHPSSDRGHRGQAKHLRCRRFQPYPRGIRPTKRQNRGAVQACSDKPQAGPRFGLAVQCPAHGAWCLAFFGGRPAALNVQRRSCV